MQGRSDPNAELLDAAALCRHLVPDDSVHAFLADHRRDLFPDEMFADLFPSGRGRPSVPADVVATVMVLQSLEGLSDRDAAAALRTNIAWKVATGLALDDAGIHYSVLTYWRSRLRDSDQPERVFDAVRAVIDQIGVLAGRRRRPPSSTRAARTTGVSRLTRTATSRLTARSRWCSRPTTAYKGRRIIPRARCHRTRRLPVRGR